MVPAAAAQPATAARPEQLVGDGRLQTQWMSFGRVLLLLCASQTRGGSHGRAGAALDAPTMAVATTATTRKTTTRTTRAAPQMARSMTMMTM